MKQQVWSIAGSDSGGGAGIQADLKTASQYGVPLATAVTALTAQNSVEVMALNPVSDEVLASQLNALATDMPARVIKIGMLANLAQVKLVAKFLKEFKTTWRKAPTVVYDPVAITSNGDALTEQPITDAIKEYLLPLVDVLTPNQEEAQLLTGVYLISGDAMIEAAKALQGFGVKNVLIKGGHGDLVAGQCVDLLLDEQQQTHFLSATKRDTPHNHGTGCTLATAISCGLAIYDHLLDAVTLAKAFVYTGLARAVRVGEGRGPVVQPPLAEVYEQLPYVLCPDLPGFNKEKDALDIYPSKAPLKGPFAPLKSTDLGVYAVMDDLNWFETALQGGIKTIQLRLKNTPEQALSDAIKKAVALSEQYDAQLFINDHWQLALEHGAYGVHLGQEDLATADLAAIQAAGCRLGVSTHGFYEMAKVLPLAPSYVAIGAVFPTITKDMTGQIQGIPKLAQLIECSRGTPTVAIGGINHKRMVPVAQTGVNGVAVVTAITHASDPAKAIQQLQSAFEQGRQNADAE